jgi:CD2 antigen cytoplasmic tail-binding protein 2
MLFINSDISLQPTDTDLVGIDELEEVEEALEVEETDGIELEPFNLAQERRDGYFDEGGNYVENKNKDDEDEEKDAWFASAKGEFYTQSHAYIQG